MSLTSVLFIFRAFNSAASTRLIGPSRVPKAEACAFIQEIFEPAYTFFIHCFGVFMHKNSACHGGVAFFGQGRWLVFKNMFREMLFFWWDKTLFLLFAGYIVENFKFLCHK
jgi:hypothetical protein